MDRLTEMEAFATVVDQGGFTDAAKKMGISKSAVSKHVSALEARLGARQAAVSQQLARLRAEGLVAARRDGKAIYYSIKDPRAGAIMERVYDLFCNPGP